MKQRSQKKIDAKNEKRRKHRRAVEIVRDATRKALSPTMNTEIDDRPASQQLFKNIKENLPKLEELLRKTSHEEVFYRFYHQSFKTYWYQEDTEDIVKMFQSLSDQPLNSWFMQIVKDGTGKIFKIENNKNWLEMNRPMLEAHFHARYFLEMMVKYGKELDYPPNCLPSGWAAVLYLYDLR